MIVLTISKKSETLQGIRFSTEQIYRKNGAFWGYPVFLMVSRNDSPLKITYRSYA